MTMNDSVAKFKDLRDRAEQLLLEGPTVFEKGPAEDIQGIIHDLQVHQIELEMQNDELHRTQQELHAERDKYSDLYDFAPVGYVTIGEKGMILGANLTMCTMLGVERRRLIGGPFSQFINRDDQSVFYCHRNKLIETRTKQTCELRIVKRDTSQFHAQMECIPVLDENGTLGQIRAAITDITDRKQAEETLRKSHHELERRVEERTAELLKVNEQLKSEIEERKQAEEGMARSEKFASLSQLSAGLAHELRNPLAVISSCSQFCLENNELKRLVRENFQIIYRNSQRANHLIEGLLAFARPGSLELEEVDVNELLSRMMQMAELESDRFGITVVKRLSEQIPKIMGDKGKLSQLFLNLIQNAIQAVSRKGKIVLESRIPPRDGTIEVSVVDDGAGIPEEYRSRVFDPFFTTKDGGTGLGLSICHTIVEHHRGSIHIESGEETGTRVSVRFPIGKQE